MSDRPPQHLVSPRPSPVYVAYAAILATIVSGDADSRKVPEWTSGRERGTQGFGKPGVTHEGRAVSVGFSPQNRVVVGGVDDFRGPWALGVGAEDE